MIVSVKMAAQRLKKGDLVAIPTETVFGLAAPICQPHVVQKIFQLKGRPSDNPLIVHVATFRQMSELVTRIPKNFSLIKNIWPGPLTVVLPAQKNKVPNIVRAGLATVAIRMPDHAKTLALIKKSGPLAAPSANLSGSPSPTTRAHVEHDFGKNFPVLDGAKCQHGVESTVIALHDHGWELLRYGAISRDQLEKILGPELKKIRRVSPISPGQKYKHYAPKAKLILCSGKKEMIQNEKKADCVIGFVDTKTGLPKLSLGKRNSHAANLRRLYSALRLVDQKKYQTVLVDNDFGFAGLGATLHERLNKAAGKEVHR